MSDQGVTADFPTTGGRPNNTGDPEKQNPGATDIASGANCKAKLSSKHEENTKTDRKTQEHHSSSFAVYDGQLMLGRIEQRGNKFTSYSTIGRSLGVFGNLKTAAAAIGDRLE